MSTQTTQTQFIQTDKPIWRKAWGRWVVQLPTAEKTWKHGDRVEVHSKFGRITEVVLNKRVDKLPSHLEPTPNYDYWIPLDPGMRLPDEQTKCAVCKQPGHLVRDLEDGELKHYRCCDIPPELGGGR